MHLSRCMEGHVAVFLCEVLYLTFLAIMTCPGGSLRSIPPPSPRYSFIESLGLPNLN
jgi:hypothetical protein